MTYRIEKGVPLPVSAGAAFPFSEMEVGDSFAVPVPTGRTVEQVRSNLSACANSFCRRHVGYRFVTRADRRTGGDAFVRCWRAPLRNEVNGSARLQEFVDPVQTVPARGYRAKKPPPPAQIDSAPTVMPRFVSGKGRY